MQLVTEMQLPDLPIDSPGFGHDSIPDYEAARIQHPWLARFSQGYLIHGYQATKDLLVNDKMSAGFLSLVDFYDAEGTPWGRFMTEVLGSRSGVDHSRLRASVAETFTPRTANQTSPLMRQVISDLLDEWAPKGEFDFALVASYFPVAVMCGLLGVSAKDIPNIRDALETQMASLTLNRDLWPEIQRAYAVISDFADEIIAAREKCGPKGDGLLLDSMIASKNARRLSATELRFMLILLLVAGYDTSKNMLSITICTMVQHPNYWTRCAEDKAFCAKVIDEMFRYSSPTSPYRKVEQEFVYDDVRFPKGTMLVFPTFFAGRDPSFFANPTKFDPERTQTDRHVAFGRGPHICLGQHIARTQLIEGLHVITQRIRNPRVAGEVKWRPFLGVWGLGTLPIAFDH